MMLRLAVHRQFYLLDLKSIVRRRALPFNHYKCIGIANTVNIPSSPPPPPKMTSTGHRAIKISRPGCSEVNST